MLSNKDAIRQSFGKYSLMHPRMHLEAQWFFTRGIHIQSIQETDRNNEDANECALLTSTNHFMPAILAAYTSLMETSFYLHKAQVENY